jgi:hypothetical protein
MNNFEAAKRATAVSPAGVLRGDVVSHCAVCHQNKPLVTYVNGGAVYVLCHDCCTKLRHHMRE